MTAEWFSKRLIMSMGGKLRLIGVKPGGEEPHDLVSHATATFATSSCDYQAVDINKVGAVKRVSERDLFADSRWSHG